MALFKPTIQTFAERCGNRPTIYTVNVAFVIISRPKTRAYVVYPCDHRVQQQGALILLFH